MTISILLLEDDPKIASEIRQYFTARNNQCDIAYDGQSVFKFFGQKKYDLLILDINVPYMNGLDVCKKIRETDRQTPILMLTAFGEVNDKVDALNIGADDYIVKPFHFDELMARINALLRRSGQQYADPDAFIQIDDLIINTSQLTVSRGGKSIELTPKEFKLLELLAQAKGRPVSKQTISEQVWDINFDTGTNTIEVYINFLRNKIDKGFATKLIHTRPGFGYYMKAS